ncbi:kinesin-like protein KIN-8A [Cryptomeria japonica]|uniref:kinesin-like protein KIN-8A n=1 Tax=Cryptomeria japonica TaxID=3369 RepID=UPI0027DA80EE|nr:kinesin-like protein KIN-8A [Cryptomeria japonica]
MAFYGCPAADSSPARGRWLNSSSASTLAAKKLRALTQNQWEKEPQIEAQKLPPRPLKTGRRMSMVNNPGSKMPGMGKPAEKLTDKGCRRHSDVSRKTSAMGKPFGHCNGNPKSSFCTNPLPSLCFPISQPESEDWSSEVSTRGKQGNASEIVPICGEDTERIMVYVRVRPLSKKEEEAGARNCVCVANKKDLFLKDFVNDNDYLRLKRDGDRQYTFDAVFDPSVDQKQVYDTSTAELVDCVLQGRNASVLCYGATGAGKTHTMLGTERNPGVMVLAIKDLFAKLQQLSFNGEHVVSISYLEIYNEAVKDLLSPGKPLVLREDKQGNVSSGITQHHTSTVHEVMILLYRGNHNRITEATRLNETSSRSHAILQVAVEYRLKEGSTTVTRSGKLSLVDLAGSERSTATDQRTLRSVEGANINKSLLALSSCIKALVEGKSHIPYRASKLTQLLKDSLGGACHTTMIANISPSNTSYSETQNTLHWANRAKEIRTRACIANEELEIPDSQIEQNKQLQKENKQLKLKVAKLEQRLLLAVEGQTTGSTPSLPCSSPLVSSPLTPPATVQLSSSFQALKEDSETMKTEYNTFTKNRKDIIRKLYADYSVSETVSLQQPSRTPNSTSQSDYAHPHSKPHQWPPRPPRLSDVGRRPARPRFSDVGMNAQSPSRISSSPGSGQKRPRPFGDITNCSAGGRMETTD